jgi:hypothetical protein
MLGMHLSRHNNKGQCDILRPRCTACMTLGKPCYYPRDASDERAHSLHSSTSDLSAPNLGTKELPIDCDDYNGNFNWKVQQAMRTKILFRVCGEPKIFTLVELGMSSRTTNNHVTFFFSKLAKVMSVQAPNKFGEVPLTMDSILGIVVQLTQGIGHHVRRHRFEIGPMDQDTFGEMLNALDGVKSPTSERGRPSFMAHTATVLMKGG